jgi:uncharacterized protein
MGLKIKAVDDAGHFTGVGAAYGNVDLGGDKILPGAFTKTLQEKQKFVLLWQHNPSEPIGSVVVSDSPQGLLVDGKLELQDPTAQKAYTFLKSGVISGLSIGYDTQKAAFVDDVRELRELKLWEISIVTFPMNQSAMVTGIKAMPDDEMAKHLKAIDGHRKAMDRHQRGMREHLKALFDGFDDDDDADDPDLGDGEDLSEQDSKEFLIEMQKMLALVKT